MLVADLSSRNARFFPDADAVVDLEGLCWSWSELDRRATTLARVFVHLAVAPGERVALLGPNCPTYLAYFFACSRCGVVGAPLNVRLTPAELARYVAYVRPRMLLVHASLAPLARAVMDHAALADAAEQPRLVGFGGDHGLSIDLDDLMAEVGDGAVERRPSGSDPYMLAATSGTTGVSKAVVLSNANAIAAIAAHAAEMPITEAMTSLQNIPMFFNPGGPAGVHPVLTKGGRVVIAPGFDPGLFLEAVPRFAVSYSILVPTMIQMVLDHPAAATADLSSLRGITCGGSPVSAELIGAARKVFGDVFYPTYGMAETYSCGLLLRPESQRPDGTDADRRRMGSAGKPHVLLDVEVVDEAGAPVPRDGMSEGEVLVRGDTVATHYFEMPAESALAFVDGWMHTGDLATVDSEGFVTIVDRLKDVIISGGINVHGREVEEVVLLHPAVAQAAVIGVPHARWGEAVHVVVVPAAGQQIDADEVLAFCQARLAAYKRPRSLEVRSELPMSATGKVLKRLLRTEAGG